MKHAVWGGPGESLDDVKESLDFWAEFKGYQRRGEYHTEQRAGRWWVQGEFDG